jgi:histidyl-tRNA synthetase
MYTLKTKGGDHLALRPEHTAGTNAFSYIEQGMQALPQPDNALSLMALFFDMTIHKPDVIANFINLI